MCKTQLGLVLGGSCFQHVTRLIGRTPEVQPESKRHQQYHWAFIDFKNALISISHTKILDRIREIPRTSHETSSLVELLYSMNMV